MTISPRNTDALCSAMAAAHADRTPLRSIDMRAFDTITEHAVDDLTVTVEAGVTLEALQRELARHGQWLPVDPPNPGRLQIDTLLYRNASGPRRFGFSTPRDHLLGITAVLSDGRLIHSGGRVVKNVAGFDLARLLTGSMGTLGVITEATFKLQPIPETEEFVSGEFRQSGDAMAFLTILIESKMLPSVIELHRANADAPYVITVGFSGSADDVAWQVELVRKMGLNSAGDLAHEQRFWSDSLALPLRHRSVLPSKLGEVIDDIGGAPFVSRAGNGEVWYRGGPEPPEPYLPDRLAERVRQTFDPYELLTARRIDEL